MRGYICLFIMILVKFCVAHVLLPGVLQTAIQNLRYKREGPCGGDIDLEVSGGVGEIQLRTETVNGTEFYRILEDCEWTVKTAEDHFIIIKSDYFSVEESENCMWDYVEITEKSEKDVGVASSRICGWNPLTYITFSNEIKIQFKSDDSFEGHGFKLLIESVNKGGDETKCADSILGGDDSKIMNNEESGDGCLFRIQAPGDKVIILNQKMLNFGSASCEEESIIIYEGLNTHGEPLCTICSDSVNGILPYHAKSMIIEYKNTLQQEGERFTIEYMFVEDNFTPAPVPSTTPSRVGGNNDCSGVFKGIYSDDGVMVYTAPEYEDDRECVVVVRNEQLPRHVVQIEFVYFDIEDSDNCTFDSLTIRSGEREDSALLGGPYCGDSLDGRTFLTSGNSLRLEFKTDESFAFLGFQAKISFVPNTDCTCKGKKKCIRQDNEKKCIDGDKCEANICQNGGTCIKIGSTQMCYCPKGFSGDDCSQGEGGKSYHLRFIKAPTSRILKRGESHTEECQVEVPHGEPVYYDWSFQGILIGKYNKNDGFGFHPGGLLQIDAFKDGLEGQYSCFARTSAGIAEHTFEYRIAEDCDVRIFPGPQSEIKKINEMALLICHVDSRAKEVRWKKDGIYIDYSKEPRIKKLHNNYLRITNVGMSDAGIYQCEAEDENGCYSFKEGKLQVINVKPLNTYCGISVHDEIIMASSRISQGSSVLPKQYPWHVSFRSRGKASEEKTFCGGTLISQRFVVTAAHCIVEFQSIFNASFDSENVQLLLGTTDCLGTQNDGIRRTVGSYTVHPNYEERGAFDNDIALVELDSPCEYNDYVRPICVAPSDYNDREFLERSSSLERDKGVVAGCGLKRRRLSRKLQVVRLPYVYREQCLDSLGDKYYTLTDTMFCAGSDIAMTGDTCKGDSGGGMVMESSTRRILTGIVSWSMGKCDADRFYGVYTNVGMFYDWIEQISKFSEEAVPDFMKGFK